MKALQILLTTIIRNGLMFVIAYLVKNNIIDSTTLGPAEITELIALIVAGLGVLWWSFYSRVKAYIEKRIALKLPPNATEVDVQKVIAVTPTSKIVQAEPPTTPQLRSVGLA